MSNLCEHPFCTRVISNKCSNHCQLDLCNEHLIEHENLFFAQYEKCFEQLKQTVNEFKVNNNHLRNQSNVFEHKSSLTNSIKYFIQKKLRLLNDVKTDKALLYQYDIEQLKLYQTIIQEYQTKDIEMFSPSTSSSSSSSLSTNCDDSNDEDYHQRSNDVHKHREITNYYGQCPLTRLGVYGLMEKHNINLCPADSNQPNLHLMTHFYNHHHIKWSLAIQLIDAIKKNSDPLTTYIFSKDIEIIDKRFYIIRCPLIDLKISNCKMKFYKNSLEKHLSLDHRNLSLQTKTKILQLIENKGYLTFDDFDANELN